MNVQRVLQDVLSYVPTAWEVSIVRAELAFNWLPIINCAMVSINNYVNFIFVVFHGRMLVVLCRICFTDTSRRLN